jgi:hypothetical protein
MALVPLGFSPIHSMEPAREVSNVLPVLDSMGARMLTLEEVVNEQLEVKCHILAEKVAEHVLTCFWSWDPQNLPGAGGARTHHRGGGGGQGQCPGCHQDRGCTVATPAKRRIGLLLQLLCLLEPFKTCAYINLLSIIVACCS